MIILLHINEMKELKQHILEKLRVSAKAPFDGITLESLIDALNDYIKRKNFKYAVYIDLEAIFGEYPVVLQYHGTYTNKNIIGNKILAIQFVASNTPGYKKVIADGIKDGNGAILIYFYQSKGESIRIENTEELNDIFGEEAVDKIYNYIITL